MEPYLQKGGFTAAFGGSCWKSLLQLTHWLMREGYLPSLWSKTISKKVNQGNTFESLINHLNAPLNPIQNCKLP